MVRKGARVLITSNVEIEEEGETTSPPSLLEWGEPGPSRPLMADFPRQEDYEQAQAFGKEEAGPRSVACFFSGGRGSERATKDPIRPHPDVSAEVLDTGEGHNGSTRDLGAFS